MIKQLKAIKGDIVNSSVTAFYDLATRKRLSRLIQDIINVLIIVFATALLCLKKDKGMDLYFTIALSFSVVYFILILLANLLDSSHSFILGVCWLIAIGATVQILLVCSDNASAMEISGELVLFAYLGILFGILAVLCLRATSEFPKSKVNLIIGVASFVLYIVLLLFGDDIHGTKAWFSIGGFSLQLTEIQKLLALINISLILSDEKLSVNRKYLLSVWVLALHSVFLVLVNELGTLLIIGVTYIVNAFIFLPSKKLIAICLCFVIIALALFGLAYKCDQWKTNGDVSDNYIVNKLSAIYKKVFFRVDVLINPQNYDYYGDAYQLNKANEAIIKAGWWGSPSYEHKVPVIESDYIVVFLLLNFGWISGILVAIGLLFILAEGYITSLNNSKSSTDGCISVALISCLVITSFLSLAMSIGLIPCVGITFPFFSRGGTSTVISYAMIIIALYYMRNKNPKVQEGNNVA